MEKYEAPLSGKYHSFRKAHESHRSGLKKTALEKYVHDSLENLDYGRKKMTSSSKQNELKSTLKKNQLESSGGRSGKRQSKEKEFFNEDTPKQAPLAAREHNSVVSAKVKTEVEREDSVERIEVKWERKKKSGFDLSK